MNFSNNKIIVIGDLILDYYRFLEAERISPEAPVVVFKETGVQWRFGGAANVANNLKAMGVNDVLLFTVVGEDFEEYKKSFSFVENLHGSHFNGKPLSFIKYIVSPSRRTTVKERLIARSQQVLRVDAQSENKVPFSTLNEMIESVMENLEGVTAIVMSDYDHGVMQTNDNLSALIAEAVDRGIKVVVDAKSKDVMNTYKGASIVVPNLNEAKMICGTRMPMLRGDEEWLAEFLRDSMGLEAAAITLGHGGAIMSTKDWTRKFNALDHGTEEVVDVTGAGDTLSAAMAAALGSGMPYDKAMEVAQAASGVVVQKLGVATASASEIVEALKRYKGAEDVKEGRRADEDAGEAGLVRGGEGEAGPGAPA